MAKGNRYKDARDKREGGGYVAFPHEVLNSVAFIGLTSHARMLLFDLAAQYKGNNNGDLCAAWTLMKVRGWKSEETLHNAKRQLLECGLIAETRKGARPNKAALYGLTWFAMDECKGKLDISPKAFPRGRYKLLEPLPPMKVKNTSLATVGVVGGAG
ncbi:hypothetical protein [Nitrosospira sp. Is2]|uniref:hypothetical protein n=1 Tax=Nitrosospira sp. Is2 TaxID=3080532 RepID=UPI002953DB4A|nr:hypothetical protein [Nitrosospira sp. Is2]WON75236.1 hypothetical protein R5L00_07100 [Nitrosospira sp. Is2]